MHQPQGNTTAYDTGRCVLSSPATPLSSFPAHRSDQAAIADVVARQQLAVCQQLLRHVEGRLEHLGVDIGRGVAHLWQGGRMREEKMGRQVRNRGRHAGCNSSTDWEND